MNIESFFSENTKKALENNPPGEWMPETPNKCIRLSSGFPEPSLVPVTELKKAIVGLLEEEEDLPFHYLGSPRMANLKRQIQKRLVERQIDVSDGELLITSGACQAIDLIARILITNDTTVAIEAPTYMEALEIFQNYTHNFISIPVDQFGLQTLEFEKILVERKGKGLPLPRFLYTIPTFQNPTGTTMTLHRRQHLLELASEYNFLILEDDAYGELFFDKCLLSLKALDKKGRVLHVGSLSKVVAPGLRIGWVVGPSKSITALAWFKKDLDHPFSQAAMATYLDNTDFQLRLNVLRGRYRTKCEVLILALEKFLPKSVSWHIPEGGYFVWIKITGVDTGGLLTKALLEGVSFVPGKHFFLDQNAGKEFLRLSFSYSSEKEIVQGIKKLGKVVKGYLK
ncbi:PLP-dependent aminotransferase family protein [Alkalihalobacterium sp. APHAB7]|uniref:aminotransferase-like domain-containing protein n=1 Tax=Alkalihalobacterium sp. APHAB7 TaxID=3402081 RepID=UPI003AAABB73